MKNKKIKAVDIGLLNAKEFRARRSKTLLNNPEAVLSEWFEINEYIKKLLSIYRKQIISLADIKNNPLKGSCRIIVTIIAFGEESRILHTLNQYVGQMDPDKYEIILLDNHPESVPRDGTYNEVKKFKKNHPEISLVYAHKVWGKMDHRCVGNARKYVFDIALTRIQNRGPMKFETIILSNDADLISMDKKYLSSILSEFEEKPFLDVMVTNAGVATEALAKPNMFGICCFWSALARTIAMDDIDVVSRQNPKPAHLMCSASAFRASTYAAVGGFNPRALMTIDLEIGWLIADARDWDSKRVVHFDRVGLRFDPRRHITAMASRVPIMEMFSDFQTNVKIRQMNNTEVIKLIPDDFDWELFQDDAGAFWQSRLTGVYRSVGGRFEDLFKRAMAKIGVKLEIVNNRVIIKDVSQMLKDFSNIFYKPKIIHSKLRKFDKKADQKSKEFFYSISEAFLKTREIRAKEISSLIEKAKKENNEYDYKFYIEKFRRFVD